MKKKIKIIIKGTVELPAGAEVIRFTDEDGVTDDHIKFAGKLYRPDIGWMQYHTSEQWNEILPSKTGGAGWKSISDELWNEHFCPLEEEWYMEDETKKDIT